MDKRRFKKRVEMQQKIFDKKIPGDKEKASHVKKILERDNTENPKESRNSFERFLGCIFIIVMILYYLSLFLSEIGIQLK